MTEETAPLPEFLTMKALRSRGWKRELVDGLLGAPDKVIAGQNGGSDIKLYETPRVLLAEGTDEFRSENVEAGSPGSKLGHRGAVRKIRAMKLRLRPAREAEIVAAAMADYEARSRTAIPDVMPEDFVDRVTYNYVLHTLTPYLTGYHSWLNVNVAAALTTMPFLKAWVDADLHKRVHEVEAIDLRRGRDTEPEGGPPVNLRSVIGNARPYAVDPDDGWHTGLGIAVNQIRAIEIAAPAVPAAEVYRDAIKAYEDASGRAFPADASNEFFGTVVLHHVLTTLMPFSAGYNAWQENLAEAIVTAMPFLERAVSKRKALRMHSVDEEARRALVRETVERFLRP